MADAPQSTDIPLLYSNAVRLGIGFTDIRFFFGEAVLPAPPANLQAGQAVEVGPGTRQTDRLCVVISPDLLPALIDGLQKAVKLYETQFGALRKPPEAKKVVEPTAKQ